MKFQTGRLQVEHDTAGREHRVELTGQLDERADLGPLAQALDGRVIFDLAQVSFINSIGVREWVRLLGALAEKRVDVVLRRCSEAMVHQMNMIAETVGAAKVESFFVPYVCDACGAEASTCIDVAAHAAELGQMEPPAQPCAACGGPMSFAEIPARYLLFVSSDSAL